VGRVIYTPNDPLDEAALLKLEADLSYEKGKNILILGVSEIFNGDSVRDKNPDDGDNARDNNPDDNIRFVVNNITTGTSHQFEYRDEAISFYNACVEDKGDGAEYELLMRLKHHVPT
jgi:hypothetical protein